MTKSEATNLKTMLTESVWQMKEAVYGFSGVDSSERDETIQVMNRNRDDLLEYIDSLVKEEADTNKEVKLFDFMNKPES